MGSADTVVVVSHGSAMRVGACTFLGPPPRHRMGIEEWHAGSPPGPVIGDDA